MSLLSDNIISGKKKTKKKRAFQWKITCIDNCIQKSKILKNKSYHKIMTHQVDTIPDTF